MSLPWGPPQAVSPLIRGLRWGLLIAGIFYARGKQKVYETMEEAHKIEYAKRKVIKDQQLAIIRERIKKEELEGIKLFESGKF